jgi:hypothetical protein
MARFSEKVFFSELFLKQKLSLVSVLDPFHSMALKKNFKTWQYRSETNVIISKHPIIEAKRTVLQYIKNMQ